MIQSNLSLVHKLHNPIFDFNETAQRNCATLKDSTEMSRVFVQNLPKYLTEDQLRKHFTLKGEITDVKILRKSDGRSRRFGFVGFKTETDALSAIKYFDKTYMDTCKISVGSESLPVPYSKESRAKLVSKERGNLPEKKPLPKSRAQTMLERLKNPESDLKEFIAVHESRATSRTWTNDADTEFSNPGQSRLGKKVGPKIHGTEKLVKQKDGVAVISKVENKRHGGKGLSMSQTHIKFADDDDEEESSDSDEVHSDNGEDDMDWLRSKVKDNMGDEEKEEEKEEEEEEEEEEKEEAEEEEEAKEEEKEETQTEEESEAENGDEIDSLFTKKKKKSATNTNPTTEETKNDPKQKQEEEDEAEPVEQSGRIFVRNLAYSCTEEDLTELFGKYGQLTEVHIPLDRETKRPKGIAYVLYLIPEHAKKAKDELDGRIFQGRLLHLLPAKPMPKGAEVQITNTKSSFKTQRLNEHKSEAGKEHNWNTLFLRADTVASAVANELGVGKADVLSRDAESMAVTLALGEAHVLSENIQFLESHGVNMKEFEQGPPDQRAVWAKKPRSRTVLIVKNLPSNVTIEELQSLMTKYGTISRLVMPPSATVALIEYAEASEARRAFRGLLLKKYKQVPLYLEWAPVNAFNSNATATSTTEKKEKEDDFIPFGDPSLDKAEREEASESTTLFVKNLNFMTVEDNLMEVFGKFGEVRAVSVARKPDPRHTGKLLSRGYGFVEYKRRSDAELALDDLQGAVMDGHDIEIKFSDKKLARGHEEEEEVKKTKGKSAKLIIRNMPFEATKKELSDVCKNFGQLKSVRLPKKFGGGHRGFAFVEYLTPQEAQNALNSLKNIHFYGRHLVVEWAKAEETIEELRDKTKKQLQTMEKSKGESQKKRKYEEDWEEEITRGVRSRTDE